MKNLKIKLLIFTLLLSINFTFIACEENKTLIEEDIAKNSDGVNLAKVDLSEVIKNIEDKIPKLVVLLKDNPVSKLKKSNLVNSKTFDFLFDTDNGFKN